MQHNSLIFRIATLRGIHCTYVRPCTAFTLVNQHSSSMVRFTLNLLCESVMPCRTIPCWPWRDNYATRYGMAWHDYKTMVWAKLSCSMSRFTSYKPYINTVVFLHVSDLLLVKFLLYWYTSHYWSWARPLLPCTIVVLLLFNKIHCSVLAFLMACSVLLLRICSEFFTQDSEIVWGKRSSMTYLATPLKINCF